MQSTTIAKPLDKKGKVTLKFSKKQYLKWYKDMLMMRKIEERVGIYTYSKNLADFVICILDKKL